MGDHHPNTLVVVPVVGMVPVARPAAFGAPNRWHRLYRPSSSVRYQKPIGKEVDFLQKKTSRYATICPMRLPEYEQALVPERKITAYLLSLDHRDGRSKAVFFMRFGFALDDWPVLATALKRHAAEHEVVAAEPTPFGTNYVVEGPLPAPDGRSPGVRVVWFIAIGERIPVLATAYPLKGAGDD